MAEDEISKRIDTLEKELKRIEGLYHKTLHYQSTDPEVALTQARKSAEAICRQVYTHEGLDKQGKPADKMMLEDFFKAFERAEILPKKLKNPFQVIQKYGNFGTHDQGDASADITEQYIQPCLQALSTVVEWYFIEYHATHKDTRVTKFDESAKGGASDENLTQRQITKILERRVRRSIALNAYGRAKSRILEAEIQLLEEEKDKELLSFKGVFTGENPIRFFFNYPFNYSGQFKGSANIEHPYGIEKLQFTSFWEKIRGVKWVSVREQFTKRACSDLPATLAIAKGKVVPMEDEIQ